MQNKTINRRLIWAFVFNLTIFILEIIGLVLSVEKHGLRVFKYYTENSNYFALIVSAIFCISCVNSIKNNAKIPDWVFKLRYISTLCLTITFVIVTLVLVPMFPNSFYYMWFESSSLYQHLLCPVISIISFLLFENSIILNRKTIFFALIPTILYGVISIILNLLKLMAGPYPFFYVYDIPWFVCVFSLTAIVLGSALIAFVIYKIYNYGYKNFNYSFNLQNKKIEP